MVSDTLLLIVLIICFFVVLRIIFSRKGSDKIAPKLNENELSKQINKLKMSQPTGYSRIIKGTMDNNDKLKNLAELAGKMKDKYVEKSKQGDEGALSRAGEMTLLQHWAEKVRNCDHTFEWKDGRRVCSKCGFEDPDSLSIEEKWAEAWL